MHYKKITLENLIIEFHNNWLGQETVIVNGQTVSKKRSVWGTQHDFTLLENGHPMHYVLTTKATTFDMFIDLQKNGKIIVEDVPTVFGEKLTIPANNFKQKGIELIGSYLVEEGIAELKKANKASPEDPEIYFYLACAYSIEEKVVAGFENLKLAVEHYLQDIEAILNEDMLAYLRMDEEFEGFLQSNFTTFDKEKMLSRNK